MKLESMAYSGEDRFDLPIKIVRKNGMDVLDTSRILLSVLEKKLEGENVIDLACSAQRAVSEGLAELAISAARKKGINNIGGSGGVFYNEAISMTIKTVVENDGFRFLQHKNSCAGDGSVSLGQAVVAALSCTKNGNKS